MKFENNNLEVEDNPLYYVQEGFDGCYHEIKFLKPDGSALCEVADPGILEAVDLYLNSRIQETNCVFSHLIKTYSSFYNENDKFNIYIGSVSDTNYDLILQIHSWDIIKFLLGLPEAIFYCKKSIKELYPLLPADRIKIVN